MLIRSILIPKEKLTTVSSNNSINDVISIIDSKGFLSLPVVDGNQYSGLISKQDIYGAFIQEGDCDFPAFSKKEIKDYIENPVQPVQDNLFIEEAADIFFRQHVRFLPVVNANQQFMGIVTQKSIFSIVTKVYGLQDAKIVIHSDDFVGSLSKILNIIEKSDVNVTNIAQFDTEVMGIQEISIRVTGEHLDKLVEKLKDRGIKVKEFIPAK